VPANLSSIAVYCGSNSGSDPRFSEAAEALGALLASRGIRLVFGGGRVGLMGIIADAVLGHGGEVHGVITRALQDKEIAHPNLTALQIVETMHARKAAMADASDGFVMLPGGYGTFDEFFEVVTWTQLGIHSKPCGVLNVSGFFDPMREQLRLATEHGFVRVEHRDMVIFDADAESLLDRLGSWTRGTAEKWIGRGSSTTS
jgi:uncharacterized protein (TIGR00730 family)